MRRRRRAYQNPERLPGSSDQLIWDHLTASNLGDPLKLAVSRFDGQNAYQSAHESWTIVPASLRGAIYYWTTSGTGYMSRVHPGTGSTPEVLDNGTCMGCHAVSADGSTLVATVDSLPSTDGLPMTKKRAWESFDLPNATTRVTSTLFGGNLAVTPDGKYTVFGNQTLHIADTAVGTEISGTGLETVQLDPNMKGLMTPVFSPDGKHFAAIEGGAAQTGTGTWYHDLTGGKLVTLDFDQNTVSFTNLQGLAPASAFPTNERASPIKLTTLDTPPNANDGNLSFEPTFNPVERGNYFWVVFTSERDWGNRITGTANNGKKRLWVAAIDKATNGPDPSHPAFFLEGQEEDTTNMRGFWALAACTPTKGGGACQAGFECCSGFCDQGVCVDVNTYTCKPLGDSCQTSSDCCNSDKVGCLNGVCAVPPRQLNKRRPRAHARRPGIRTPGPPHPSPRAVAQQAPDRSDPNDPYDFLCRRRRRQPRRSLAACSNRPDRSDPNDPYDFRRERHPLFLVVPGGWAVGSRRSFGPERSVRFRRWGRRGLRGRRRRCTR